MKSLFLDGTGTYFLFSIGFFWIRLQGNYKDPADLDPQHWTEIRTDRQTYRQYEWQNLGTKIFGNLRYSYIPLSSVSDPDPHGTA